jgi:hypothetical protein
MSKKFGFEAKRFLVVFLVIVLMASIYLPQKSVADSTTYHGLTVTSPNPLTGVNPTDIVDSVGYDMGYKLEITNSTDELTLSGTGDNKTYVVVNPGNGNTTRLILDGANIDSRTLNLNAITVMSGTLELIVAQGSTNTINRDINMAGLYGGIICFKGSNLIIDGLDKTGTLDIRSYEVPCVGAGAYENANNFANVGNMGDFYSGILPSETYAGNITINNANITASAYSGAPTGIIGAGCNMASGNVSYVGEIKIFNSEVRVSGSGGGGAAIGGGSEYKSYTGNITITDSSIHIEKSYNGNSAGIGGGYTQNSDGNASVGDISIYNSIITAADNVQGNGAAIGGGFAINLGNSSAGDIYITQSSLNFAHPGIKIGATIGAGSSVGAGSSGVSRGDASAGNIVIGETVAVFDSNNQGAWIGGGCSADCGDITLINVNMPFNNNFKNYNGATIGGGVDGKAGNINILGGYYNIQDGSGKRGAVIGGGYTTVVGGDASVENIYVSGASLQVSNSVGAGLGGGFIGGTNSSAGALSVTIDGETDFTVLTSGGHNGAGIGGGSTRNANPENSYAGVKDITINSGSVDIDFRYHFECTPIGGGDLYTQSGGIYCDASVDNITINGGKIQAFGYLSTYGTGIGGGFTTANQPPRVNVGTIRINGGTVDARGAVSDIGTHRQDANTTVGSIIIQGGSIILQSNKIFPFPKNLNGDNLAPNVLTMESSSEAPNTKITAGDINNTPCVLGIPTYPNYGINDVYTNNNSEIYPWLPPTTNHELIVMQIGSTGYANAYIRGTSIIAETLHKTVLTSPAGFIDPDGSSDENNPTLIADSEFTIIASSGAHAFPVSVNYYLNGDTANVQTIDSTELLTEVAISLPEGTTSITYWASDATDLEDRITKYFFIDTTKPNTSVNYSSGEYDHALAITIKGIDANGVSGSGIDNTYYTLSKDGNVIASYIRTFVLYLGTPINLDTNGDYTLTTYSVDKIGNIEAVSTYNYKINIKQESGTSNEADPDQNVRPILGYDQNGRPIIGYDQNGRPIIGYDQNGNPIYGSVNKSANTGEEPIVAIPVMLIMLIVAGLVFRKRKAINR